MPASNAAAQPESVSSKKVGPAVIIGSALEWFDFYLYASMAALVFGQIFFPDADSAAATMAAMATFAVGFLARPLGGVVFGMVGDKLGRKTALSLTFLLMGISSGAIGLLPSYASAGIGAPLLLVFLRLLQGLGAGAEFSSAIATSYEHAKEGSRGGWASWPALGTNIGLFLSSLTVAVLTSFSSEFLYSWGWRIPFVASFALVGVGYWVRRQMPETPEFDELSQVRTPRRTAAPLRSLVTSHWRGLAVVIAIAFGYNGVSYIFKTFSLSYLKQFRDVPANVGSLGVMIASACAIAVVPLAGRLCDVVGPRAVLAGGALGTAAMAFPFFWLLDTGQNILIWFALAATTGVVVPAMLAAQGSFFAQQFPAIVRATGLGTGREVGGSLGGGLAPLVALALVTASPVHATWGVSLLFVAGAVLVGLPALLLDQSGKISAAASVPQDSRRGRTART